MSLSITASPSPPCQFDLGGILLFWFTTNVTASGSKTEVPNVWNLEENNPVEWNFNKVNFTEGNMLDCFVWLIKDLEIFTPFKLSSFFCGSFSNTDLTSLCLFLSLSCFFHRSFTIDCCHSFPFSPVLSSFLYTYTKETKQSRLIELEISDLMTAE